MFNLDPAKLLIIGVVAVVLLGPDRLPQVARQVGGAWRTFNEFRHRMETEVRSSIPDLPSTNEIARLARSPSALLNHLSNMDDSRDDAPADAPSGVGVGETGVGDGVSEAGDAGKSEGEVGAESVTHGTTTNGASPNGASSNGATPHDVTSNGATSNGATSNGAMPSREPASRPPISIPPDVTVTGDPSLN